MTFLHSVTVYYNSTPLYQYFLHISLRFSGMCFTATVNDILAELAELGYVFQRSCITPLKAFEFPKVIIEKP